MALLSSLARFFIEIPHCMTITMCRRREVCLYDDVITKFSRLDGLPIFLAHGSLKDHFANNCFVS